MKSSLRVILGFLKKEFAQTLRDPVMRLFLFGAPLLQLTIFGYAITTEFKNLKLAVLLQPDDSVMRELSGHFYNSGWFTRAEAEQGDPEKALYSGAADAVLIAPPGGLTKALGRGNAGLQLLIDASNATKARIVEAYASSMVQKYAASRFPAREPGPGLAFNVRILYNPSLETSYFMVPGVMTMIIALITVMLTGMSMAREKEMGTFETIISAPLKNSEIVLGKTIPFVVLGMADALLVIAAGLLIFKVPIVGNLFVIFAASFIFVCTAVSAGLLISTFARTQQQAMMGTFLFIFPANLMSGIMFPIENMPLLLRAVAYINPIKYYASLLRNNMLKGSYPVVVLPDLAVLTLMLLVIVFITIRRFRRTLN